MAKRLAADGFHVVIFDITDGTDTVSQIESAGGRATYVSGDVTNTDDIENAIDGYPLDVLVNNAAYYAPLAGTEGKQQFEQIEEDEWDTVFAVNVKGPFLASKSAIPHFDEEGGSIINISSDAVLSGAPGFLHYISSKAALIGFTRGLANEVGDRNIRVNAIMPGFTASDASLSAGDSYFDERVASQALDQRIHPEDIAGVVSFLAGDDSAMISGEVIVANAGRAFN